MDKKLNNLKVKKLSKIEIGKIVQIASENFSAMKEVNRAKKWITGNFKNYPRMQYYVAKIKGNILGYILWVEKGGFREKSVWELEQVTVKEEFGRQGIGSQLILKSLEQIKNYLKKRGSSLKIIEVKTRKDNTAQDFYRKILGAKVECLLKDFYRGDEIVMIARKNQK